MKKNVLFLLMLWLPVIMNAYEQIGGIYYYLNSSNKTAIVVNNDAYPYSGDVVIPSEVIFQNVAYTVIAIENKAFYCSTSLTSVTIPNSVTSIGSTAFYGCSGLTSVTIDCPNVNACFSRFSNIKEIHLGEHVTTIGENAFSGCTGLTSILIPSNVTSIGDKAFYGCTGLTSISIPSSVESLGSSVFSECTSLVSIIVDGENNKYDSRENCNAIIEISSNTLIAGCQNTIIPSSVISIGQSAFNGCTGLTSINIPENVTSIGSSAFNGCTGLTSINIPENVTSIGGSAFYGCTGLTSINIPENVTSIGGSAFYGCTDLTSITINSNNIELESWVFYNCYRLTTIYCLSPIPPYCHERDLFTCNNLRDKYDIYTYATLHVPMGSKELYSSAFEWRYFTKIKEDMEANGKVYYANLTVKQGTVGYTRQAVKAAETYTIYIGSLGDNKVNTVLFNGVDVTSSIVNGYYTTPEIKGESEISISFESETSVKSMQVDNLKVSGYNGEIRVQNIEKPSDIYVYSVDGKLVNSALSTIGSSSIQVDSDQLYMVKVGNRTFKVAL